MRGTKDALTAQGFDLGSVPVAWSHRISGRGDGGGWELSVCSGGAGATGLL